MNFVIYYGSTKHKNMNLILDSLKKHLDNHGHTYTIHSEILTPCINCGNCIKTKKCVICDPFSKYSLKSCDGIIILSPIFFFSFSAKSKAFIDRLYSVDLEGKILTAITTSGSETNSVYCGFDLIEETLIRTSEYCGSKYVQPINFVTHDVKLDSIDEKIVENFVHSLEV